MTEEQQSNTYFENYKDDTLKLTKVVNHPHVKILMKEVIDIFNKSHVQYWIDHGTLLGCLRNNRFIPWDDDADISTFQSNHKKVEKLLKMMCDRSPTRYYLKVGDHFCYYFSKEENTHIDVFFYRPIENAPHIYELIHGIPWHLWSEDIIGHLPSCKLEGLIVKIPNGAEIQMERHYGIGWRNVVHKYQSGKEKEYYSKSHTDEYHQILDWKLLWEDDRQDKIDQYFEKYPEERERIEKERSEILEKEKNTITEPIQKTTVAQITREQKTHQRKEHERKKKDAQNARRKKRS